MAKFINARFHNHASQRIVRKRPLQRAIREIHVKAKRLVKV